MIKSAAVTLAHGDGGEATLRFIHDEILTRFGNPSLNQLEDGSQISLGNNNVVISTDSYIVDPPLFPGGDIGRLAIAGTVNDLLACGALLHSLTLSLILTEGFPLSTLRQILDSAQYTANSVGAQIVAGDTKVLPKETRAGIYINTTGLGLPISTQKTYAVTNAQVGDSIIITGSIGDHSLAVLSAREGLGFEQRLQSDCAPLNEFIIPLLKAFDGIHALRDPTRGGLSGVLLDITESLAVDVVIDQDLIPLKPEVQFGSEMLGLDPLNLANEGKMVIIAAPTQAGEIITQLRQHPLSKESAIIGTIRQAQSLQGRLILRKSHKEIIIDRPKDHLIPRLC